MPRGIAPLVWACLAAAGTWPVGGADAQVVNVARVESLDGYFADKDRGGSLRVPKTPTYLSGDGLRLRFHGTGFFPEMGITLQDSRAYDNTTNSSTGTDACALAQRANSSVAAHPAVDLSKGTGMVVYPSDIDPNGTWVDITLLYDYHFNNTSPGFAFCFQWTDEVWTLNETNATNASTPAPLAPAPDGNATLGNDSNANATNGSNATGAPAAPAFTYTAPDAYNFTVFSEIFLEVYEIVNFSIGGDVGPGFTYAVGSTTEQAVLTTVVPWNDAANTHAGGLYAALSVSEGCGVLQVPLGWGQQAEGSYDDANAVYPVEQPFVIFSNETAGENDTTTTHYMHLDTVEMNRVRTRSAATTFYMCVKADAVETFYLPLMATDNAGTRVSVTLDMRVNTIAHLTETLTPHANFSVGYSVPPLDVRELSDFQTIRVLTGYPYVVAMTHVGVYDWMPVSIRQWCGANDFDGTLDTTGMDLLNITNVTTSTADLAIQTATPFVGYMMCLSRRGPKVAARYDHFSGFQVTSIAIMGIGDMVTAYNFSYGLMGRNYIFTSAAEVGFMRVKFEGGDGVGEESGDEYIGPDPCTQNVDGVHDSARLYSRAEKAAIPSYARPEGGFPANASLFNLSSAMTSEWRVDAAMCVTLYPGTTAQYQRVEGFKVGFVTQFTTINYTDVEFAHPTRGLYLYRNHVVEVGFIGGGLFPELRMGLGLGGIDTPCKIAMTGTDFAHPTILAFEGVSQPNTVAWWYTPTEWVENTIDGVICMAVSPGGDDYRFNTRWQFKVMELLTISRKTHLDLVYGVSGSVYSLGYVNGEIGNHLAIVSNCSEVTRYCGGAAVNGGYCNSADPFQQAAIAGCLRDPLGLPGGANARLSVASNVPPPGNILFLYNCQTSQHTHEPLKICYAPFLEGVFSDTGLTVSIKVVVDSVVIDGATVSGSAAAPTTVSILRGKTPRIKLIGSGLYAYMQLAILRECGTLPPEDYENNATYTATTRPWEYFAGSDTDEQDELQYTPSVGNTQEILTGWKFCLSEFGPGTQDAANFSIELPFRLNIVEVTAINGSRTNSFPYGERTPLVLSGINTYKGMQVKFARSCSNVAPVSDVCNGNFGISRAEGGTGCNLLSDTICYHVPNTGLQVDDGNQLWFFMHQAQSSQLADGVRVCASLYPEHDIFHDTGLTVDFEIITDSATVHDEVVRPHETILVYKNFNDFLYEEWPTNDPRSGRVVEIHITGRGFRDFYRVKFQEECGNLDESVGGPPVPLIPYVDPNGVEPRSCGLGDTNAYFFLTNEHTKTETPENLKLCYSTAERGTNFFGRSTLYLGVVELASLEFEGVPRGHADLPYGYIGDLRVHGASIMPYMQIRFAEASADGICFPPGISSFDSALFFSSMDGTDTRPLPADLGCAAFAPNGECRKISSPASPANIVADVTLSHLHTFRHITNLKVCLSLWGGLSKFYDTGLTVTTGVFVNSVESYQRHHDGTAGRDHLFVYTKYPQHTITIHGRGFYDHHRVLFTKGSCSGAIEGIDTSRETEIFGPFPVIPISLPNRTRMETSAGANGLLRTTALVEMVIPRYLEQLNMCFSVYATEDDANYAHFALPMNVQLYSVDIAVEKYFGMLRETSDPIVFNYGGIGRVTFAKDGLPTPGPSDTFVFQLNSDCGARNVTVGVVTPVIMVFLPVRDRVTNVMIEGVPAVAFPSSVTRQYSHQKLCFSPYPPPNHHFLDTGYEVYVECEDPAFSCDDVTQGICDANATRYHQIVQGCDCEFSQRSNFSCSLGTNAGCSAATTCSGHGVCAEKDLCECDTSYYGPSCAYCDVGVRNVEYTPSQKHLIVHFSQGYTVPSLAVAALDDSRSCEHLLSEADRESMKDPSCYWEAPDRLHVMMGYGGVLKDGVLTLDTEAISARCEATRGGHSPLVIPQSLPQALVVPFLLIPESITICDEVVLDGSLSWATGGEIEYLFSLQQSPDHAFSATFDNYLRSRRDTSLPTLRVPTQYIPMGSYLVKLTVKSIRSGTNESDTKTLRKEQETVPPSLVVTIPQVAPYVIDATDQSLQIGPVEVASYMFSNIPSTCFNLDNSPAAVAGRSLRYSWQLWWYTQQGDMYYDEFGRGWRETEEAGSWRRAFLPAEADGYQTLYLPLYRESGAGVVESFLANRTAEVRVRVELYEKAVAAAATPAPTIAGNAPVPAQGVSTPESIVAVGTARLQMKRFPTPMAFFEGANRTVSTSFTLQLVVRVGAHVLAGSQDIYATRWWCNDTSSLPGDTTGPSEVPCPEPLRQVVNATARGLTFPFVQGRTRFTFGPPSTEALPPGRYLFTAAIYIPKIKAYTRAVAEIRIRTPVLGVEFLDVGVMTSNASLHYQHVGSDKEFALAPRMLTPRPAGVEYRYQWSLWTKHDQVQLPAVADATAETLRVPPGVLRTGGTYEVKLLVRELSTTRPGLVLRQAQPEFKLYVWSPPHGGRLRLAQRPDGDTVLFADGWVIEPARYPLRYMFSNELFCGNVGGCTCCNAGQAVGHPVNSTCEARCGQCICTVLSDYRLRNYLPVTIPRTQDATVVEYEVKVIDRYGVAASASLTVPTIPIGDGAAVPDSAATPVPYGPEDLGGEIDSTGLSSLSDALTRRNVPPFLQSLAEVVTGMRLRVGGEYATTVCPNGEAPANGEGCTTVYPREEDIPLLSAFPKDPAMVFQVDEILKMSSDMVSSIANAEQKQRLMTLVLSAMRQPSYISRGAATRALSFAHDLVTKSEYLNVAPEFYPEATTMLSRILRATMNVYPDDITPGSAEAGLVSAEAKLAIREQKKQQARMAKATIDAMRVRFANGLNVNATWDVAGEGLTIKCKRVPTARPSVVSAVVVLNASVLGNSSLLAPDPITPAPVIPFIDPTASVYPQSSVDVCDPDTSFCNTTQLGMSYQSPTGLIMGADNTETTSCVETYPTNVHDYADGGANVTATNVIGYTVYENGTERQSTELVSYILTLPMDKGLYQMVQASKEPNKIEPACYWFDPSTRCETATTAQACNGMCCKDFFEGRRLFGCRLCCQWNAQAGTCEAGPRGGRDNYRTDGCAVASYDENKIHCNCTHLTDFVQGYVASVFRASSTIQAMSAPDRLNLALPLVAEVTPPNIASLPQVFVLPILFVALVLYVLSREESFRRAHDLVQLGKHAILPWDQPMSTADKEYIRARDDETGASSYIRKVALSNTDSDASKIMQYLRGNHIYFELFNYRYDDNIKAVYKVISLFVGISCCWAINGRVWMDTDDSNINFGDLMLYSFVIASVIGPVTWLLKAGYGQFERNESGMAVGEYLRKAWIAHRTKSRLNHARVKQEVPQANPEFYAPGQMPEDEEEMAPLQVQASIVGDRRMSKRRTSNDTMRALGRNLSQELSDLESRMAWEVDCVVDAMEAWKRDERIEKVLTDDPEPLSKSICVGSANIDPETESEASTEEDSVYRGLTLRKKVNIPNNVHFADRDSRKDNGSNSGDAGGSGSGPAGASMSVEGASILTQPRAMLQQVCYDIRCGRFIVAVHLLYQLHRYTQINKGVSVEDMYGLMEKAMRKASKLATQIFGFSLQEYQVALAYEERRTPRWWDGIQSIQRDGGHLINCAGAFVKHLQRDPFVKKCGLAERTADVKGWCYYYFTRAGNAGALFGDAWAAVLSNPISDGDVREEYSKQDVPLSVEYETLGLPDGKLFTREEVLAEIIAGRYVKAEFMVNRLQEGEVLGNLLATKIPGEFELVGDITDDIETFAHENEETITNSRFWVLYIASLAQGVAKFTFDKEYTLQLRQLLQRRQRISERKTEKAEHLAHIPTRLQEERGGSDGDFEEFEEIEEYEEYEEWEEVEEETEEGTDPQSSRPHALSPRSNITRLTPHSERGSLVPRRSNRDAIGAPPSPSMVSVRIENSAEPVEYDTYPLSDMFINCNTLEEQLKRDFLEFKQRAVRETNPDPVEEDKEDTQGKATALKLVKSPIEANFYVRPVPLGFRSRGEFSNRLGIGTEDSPFCSLEYCFKVLKVRGDPSCRVILLGGIYPAITIKNARNCEIVPQGGAVRVQIRGRDGNAPVVVFDACRNMKITGLEISHGSVAVDASTSIDVFVYDNVMSDVLTGVVNPKIACLGDSSQDIDFNFCNFILQRPAHIKEYFPANYSALLTLLCAFVGTFTYVMTTLHMLDMTSKQLAFNCIASYLGVVWDAVFWQAVLLYLSSQITEQTLSQDTWNHLFEKGLRTGYQLPAMEDL